MIEHNAFDYDALDPVQRRQVIMYLDAIESIAGTSLIADARRGLLLLGLQLLLAPEVYRMCLSAELGVDAIRAERWASAARTVLAGTTSARTVPTSKREHADGQHQGRASEDTRGQF